MANRIRGEVPLTLGGRRYTLCLTLGALAELEAALQAGDLAGLAARFAGGRVSARDLIALLGVALRGGGHDLDDGPRVLVHLASPEVVQLGARLRITGTDAGDLVAEVTA